MTNEIVDKIDEITVNLGSTAAVVDDLCYLTGRRDSRLRELDLADSVNIIACNQRAVRSLLEFNSVELPEEVKFYDVSNGNLQPALSAINALVKSPGDDRRYIALKSESEDQWRPWYPVIDFERCTNCLQCLNFCLFGVYDKTEDNAIIVSRPDRCKNLCPACARVCPAGAVIFPHHNDPIINGSELPPSQANKGFNAVSKGDVYAALRKRSESETDNPIKRMQEDLGIPMEVVKSLSPSIADQLAARCNSDSCDCDCDSSVNQAEREKNNSDCGPNCACHDNDNNNCGSDCACHEPQNNDCESDCDCRDESDPTGNDSCNSEGGCCCD